MKKFIVALIPPSIPKLLMKPLLQTHLGLLKELCSGKSVLHIGCADHINLIDAKRNAGTWIHGYLSQISSKCIGIDINREAIDYLRDRLGITNVMHADIIKEIPVSLLHPPAWDKVFLG